MKPTFPLVVGTAVLLVGCPREEPTEPVAMSQAPDGQAQQAIDPEPTVADEPARTAMRDLDEGPPRHVTFRPGEIPWQDGPGSFEEGAQFAVLEGDPAEPGVFTMQIKMPDGFVINPHWHPNVERVTVLAGTFHLGHGEQVDKEAADALPLGSYTAMPPEMVHHAIAGGETIIQLTSVGPWEINYIDPADDPRQRD